MAHATTIIPCASDAPLVVTVHDLAFVHEPEHFTQHGVRVFERSLRMLRERAALVLCSSAATAADCRGAGIDADRLRVVPLGVEATPASPADVDRVRAAHRLPARFALFVGTIEPRKNLANLGHGDRTRRPATCPLVVAGADGWGDGDAGRATSASSGSCPPPTSAALYAAADVFCYPEHARGLRAAGAGGDGPGHTGGHQPRHLDRGGRRRTPRCSSTRSTPTTSPPGSRLRSTGADELADARPRAGRVADVGAHRRADRRGLPGSGAPVTVDVAVNLLWCVPGRVGGSEEYLVRQLLGLARHAAADGAACRRRGTRWSTPPTGSPPPIPTSLRPPTCATRRFDGVQPGRDGSPPRRPGCVHGTGAAPLRHHGGGTAPTGAERPYVLTIHDLQYRTFPEHFSRVKRRYFDATMPRSARRAAIVAVPSEFVRATVVEAYGLAGDRVAVVPHGFEPALRTDVAGADVLRRRYALGDGPVIVYPGGHPPAQEPPLPARADGDALDRPGPAAGAHRRRRALPKPIVTACLDRRVCRLGRVPSADRNGLIAAWPRRSSSRARTRASGRR